jgi:para-nitrobenzyl esterase
MPSLRPKATGAEHASEVAYLFNTLDASYGKDVSEKDRRAARALHTYIANFVKYGDPNGGDLPNWPKFDLARSELLSFTPDSGPVFGPDPWRECLDLVERAAAAHASSQNTPAGLGGTSWQMVKFEGGDGTTLIPDSKSKYTITFGTDGRVSARIDGSDIQVMLVSKGEPIRCEVRTAFVCLRGAKHYQDSTTLAHTKTRPF